jgi:hypothetical protein
MNAHIFWPRVISPQPQSKNFIFVFCSLLLKGSRLGELK